MSECLFCKISAGTIPSSKVYEDSKFLCIKDIHPQAAVHWLVIPRQHVESLDAAFPSAGDHHGAMVGELMETAVRIARKEGLLPGGFRTVINTGRDGGQTVPHLHVHILGGKPLKERMV